MVPSLSLPSSLLRLSFSYGALSGLPHPQAGLPHELTFRLPHIHVEPSHSLTLTLRLPHLRASI
uniref:Uncharacterized protein n=1 Tax=Fagus sylvatica TaxID=28930 RepID=A0A2N9HJL2_FAGSY